MNLRGRRVAVVGLAESGLAATELLRELGADVVVTETRSREELSGARRAEQSGAVVRAGGHEREHLDGVDLVLTSPGIPEHSPVLGWAAEAGIPVWSEIELGARLVECPYVVVTGTNGKTTVTELIAAAMCNAGVDAIACGNVGYPLSRAAKEGREALVVEASSFQLRYQESLRPRVSVLLNLAPDHLDWHGSLQGYVAAKARVFEYQTGDDVHVGNLDDPAASALSREASCQKRWFSVEDPRADAYYRDGRLVVREHDLGPARSSLRVDRANAAAAALAAIAFGIPGEPVGRALDAFEPGPHRGRTVAEVEGVSFVDDSKATNPHAALASIAGHGPVVLIAGGLAKGVDLAPLAAAASHLLGVVAIGEAAPEVAAVFEGLVPVRRARSIEEAAQQGLAMARPGSTVLLAPACASQDMFRDYAERGDRFAEAARRLASERTIAHG